tara:strand:- start:142 stop:351 length:210 start_codon:yes stop_codon:yes gene_type:complete
MSRKSDQFALESVLESSLKIISASNLKEETLEGMLLQMSLLSQVGAIFKSSENKLKLMIEKTMIREEAN